jgi:carbon-monoxide dehydrogenase medium subunit
MKPAPFEYHAPESLGDVTALLAEYGDEGKVLAGGQSLVPMLALRLTRFEHIIDLNRVDELRGVSRSNGTLTVKAMTTQRTVEHDAAAGEAVPLLAEAIPLIGHFQIRNRGTVGGSIAHADPASELPAVALALDAELEVAGRDGTRVVPAADFFVGTWTTTVGEDEILSAVRFPVWSGRTGFAVEEVARRSGDFALTGVVAAVELDDAGKVQRAGLSFLGMAPTPVRARAAEAALIGNAPSGSDLDEIGRLAVGDTDPTADVHASAEYRKHVGAHLVVRALDRAMGAASRG